MQVPKLASALQIKQQRIDVRIEITAIADAIFTLTQQRVYALLFGQPNRQFFVTEIIALAGGGRDAVQSELAKLARTGLATA